MNVTKQVHRINAPTVPVRENNFLSGRIGFWGTVTAQNSLTNTVTVISDTGYEYSGIQVYSKEWVTIDKNKDYIPSTRNLPPVNSRVFVLTPTFTAVGAFVLCSGFSRGDENIRTLWAQSESELEEKNSSRETKTQGGWDITENYNNGNSTFYSNDENIKLDVQVVDDEQDSSKKKKIELTAWDNKITINTDGISITDINGNQIQTTDNGYIITDAKGNIVQSGIDNNKELFKINVVKKSGGVITTSSYIELNADKAIINVGGNSGTKIEASTTSVKINNHLEVTL